MLLIKNGRVIDPATKTDASLDVLLDGEKIKEVGPAGKVAVPQGTEVFDASELIVAPGFIDLHAHLREPGQESSETIETGTRAAARGGFTAVCCMPNTRPVNDNASVTRFILDRAKAGGSVRVWPIGAASVGSNGEAIAEIAGMKEAGIVAVSDDGKPIATAKLTRQVMDYCRSLDLPVIEHSEDVSLAAGAVMREGVTSTRLGLRGMPAAAESVCVTRDVQLAELTGARLHVAHLSAKASLEQVRWAKSRGLRVSCERGRAVRFEVQDESAAGGAGGPRGAARRLGGRNGGCHCHGSCTARASAERRGVRSRTVWDPGIRNGAGAGTGTIGAQRENSPDADGGAIHGWPGARAGH